MSTLPGFSRLSMAACAVLAFMAASFPCGGWAAPEQNKSIDKGADMKVVATNFAEFEAIRQVLDFYVDGARQGKSEVMKKAFHSQATMYGYIGGDLA